MSEFILSQESVASIVSFPDPLAFGADIQTLREDSKSPESGSQTSTEGDISQEDSSSLELSKLQTGSSPPSYATIATAQTIEITMTASSQNTDIDNEDVLEEQSMNGSSISRMDESVTASGDSQISEGLRTQITTPANAFVQEASSLSSMEESHHREVELDHTDPAETGDIEVDEPTQSSLSNNAVVTEPTSTNTVDATSSTVNEDFAPTQKASSSQDSVSTNQSAPASASTDDDPGIMTPEQQSQFETGPSQEAIEGDVSFGTPPLSPDNDDSMLADTSIETVDNEAAIFYNGQLGRNSPVDFFEAKTDGETDEDSSDDEEEVILAPRLLTYAIPTPKLKRPVRRTLQSNTELKSKNVQRQTSSRKAIDNMALVDDPFIPANLPIQQDPKTPRRTRKNQPIRCRGSTEPPRLLSAFKSGPSYEPPKPRSRPFFPYQTSDVRRAGSAEPSSSTLFSGEGQESYASIVTQNGETPSRPLHLLANAASDAAEDNEHPHVTPSSWLQSGTLTELGSQLASPSINAFGTMDNNQSVPASAYPSTEADDLGVDSAFRILHSQALPVPLR
jgi:hypothetical protein